MKSDFKLIGLSRPSSATLTHLDNDKEIFWVGIKMPPEKINELWDFCNEDWRSPKIAEVEHEGLNYEGVPIEGKLVGVRLMN